jgi:stress response protein SCP2
MAFNLQKIETGERFSLNKSLGLDDIRVELTWDGGDLDVQAWLLNASGVIINNEAFVFYNSENRTEAYDRAKHGAKANYLKMTRPMSADGAVLGAKDEQKGGIETVNITLSKIDSSVQEILVSATIYDAGSSFCSSRFSAVPPPSAHGFLSPPVWPYAQQMGHCPWQHIFCAAHNATLPSGGYSSQTRY